MVNSLLEIAGLALLVVAAAFVAIPLAIVVAGLELVLLANLREARKAPSPAQAKLGRDSLMRP
jgi:hypothetical protein